MYLACSHIVFVSLCHNTLLHLIEITHRKGKKNVCLGFNSFGDGSYFVQRNVCCQLFFTSGQTIFITSSSYMHFLCIIKMPVPSFRFLSCKLLPMRWFSFLI